MDSFYYSALSKSGHQTAGSIMAEDEKASRSILNKLGLAILMLGTHEEAIPGLPEGQRFYYEGKTRQGVELKGYFDAPDLMTAYDRLTLEFETSLTLIIGADSSESEREEARTIGITPILDAKQRQIEEEKEKKSHTFSGKLSSLMKRPEEAAQATATTPKAETPTPPPTAKPAAITPPPAPAPEPPAAPPAPKLRLSLDGHAAPADAPKPMQSIPVEEPAPLPKSALSLADTAPEAVAVTLPSKTTATPAPVPEAAPEEKKVSSVSSALDMLKGIANKPDVTEAVKKRALAIKLPSKEEQMELAKNTLRSTLGTLTAALSLALFFFAFMSRFEFGTISELARDLALRSKLLPFAVVCSWVLFGIFEISSRFHSQQLLKTGLVLAAAGIGMVFLGVNFAH